MSIDPTSSNQEAFPSGPPSFPTEPANQGPIPTVPAEAVPPTDHITAEVPPVSPSETASVFTPPSTPAPNIFEPGHAYQPPVAFPTPDFPTSTPPLPEAVIPSIPSEPPVYTFPTTPASPEPPVVPQTSAADIASPVPQVPSVPSVSDVPPLSESPTPPAPSPAPVTPEAQQQSPLAQFPPQPSAPLYAPQPPYTPPAYPQNPQQGYPQNPQGGYPQGGYPQSAQYLQGGYPQQGAPQAPGQPIPPYQGGVQQPYPPQQFAQGVYYQQQDGPTYPPGASPYFGPGGPPPPPVAPAKKSRTGLIVGILVLAVLVVLGVVLYPVFFGDDPKPGTSTTSTSSFNVVPNLTVDQFVKFAEELNDAFIHGDVDVYDGDDQGCGTIDAPPEIHEAMYDYGEPINYGYLDMFADESAALAFLDSRLACWTSNNQSIADIANDSEKNAVLGDINVVTIWTDDVDPFQFVQYSNVVLYYTGGSQANNPIAVGAEMRNLILKLFA